MPLPTFSIRVWGIALCLWFATLTAFRRDPAWELVLEAAVFLLASASFLRNDRLRAWKLALGLAAVGGLGLAQIAAEHTISPSATALASLRWLALAAWCVTVQRELSDLRGRFLEFIVYGAGAFALLSLAMGWTSGGRLYWWWPSTHPDVLGPWVNPNHFAVWCELMLAPAVWLAAQRRQFWWAAVAIAAGVAASGSRAGLGLMSLEVVLLLVLLGWRRRDLFAARSKLALGLLVFPLLAAVLGGDQLWRKLRDPEPLLYRDQMWRSSIVLWRAEPWFGHGLGTFERSYPAAATFDTGELVDHAHNDWLEWGVEGGWVLVAAMLAGCLSAVRLTRLVPWLVGVPIAGLHALVDYPFARFPLCLWLVLLLTLANLERSRFKVNPRPGRCKSAPGNTHKKGPAAPLQTRAWSGETALH